MVYSCIARQYYYEKKLLYGARKQERRERKKMQKQFEFAEEESKFLREQRISELAEQRAMATEEQYQKDLEWGKLMEACLSVLGGLLQADAGGDQAQARGACRGIRCHGNCDQSLGPGSSGTYVPKCRR